MTDLEKLKEVLLNQAQRGIDSGEWPECEATTEKAENDQTILKIETVKIGFVFNRNGRFVGIFNWKE